MEAEMLSKNHGGTLWAPYECVMAMEWEPIWKNQNFSLYSACQQRHFQVIG